MNGWLHRLSDNERKQLTKAEQPQWTDPMLATLTEKRFSHPDWIFERKLDGERAPAFRQGTKIQLLTRNRKEIGGTYPELAEVLSGQD